MTTTTSGDKVEVYKGRLEWLEHQERKYHDKLDEENRIVSLTVAPGTKFVIDKESDREGTYTVKGHGVRANGSPFLVCGLETDSGSLQLVFFDANELEQEEIYNSVKVVP